MNINKKTPEELLKSLQEEEKKESRGHLKIFFGYAAGVGKTYAMLEAAHEAKNRGIDVIAGYIEPHARPQTAALLSDLEILPTLKIKHNNIELHEFNIDAAIKRHPQLILVDELAHTNAEGSRHIKRYQDVEELLKTGINVYTTINVQHIESLNDMVASITGIAVRERIPDSVFDNADQVEMIDIEPQDLIDRLKSGKVYQENKIQRAIENFFTIENLTALREISLRRCADRVSLLTENARIKSHGNYYTDEHILVCISPSPSNAKIIRTAARMANAFRGIFTGIFVETPDFSSMKKDDIKRLHANMRLAEQLGAKIEIVYGEDVPSQIAEFARLSGVSKIVIGRSSATKKHFPGKTTFTEKLIEASPDLDIHIIPDSSSSRPRYHLDVLKKHLGIVFSISDIMKSILVLFLASCIGLLFYHFGFEESNIITVYVFAVLITSIITKNRFYSLISSIISVLIFNFLFTIPRFSFLAYDKGYPVTFLIMFSSALLTSSLAVKLKNHAKQASQSAFRTKVLLDTNQALQQAQTEQDIMNITASHLITLLKTDIIFYFAKKGRLDDPCFFSESNDSDMKQYCTENEKAVALWVLKNNTHAGATTQTLSNAKCLYLSIRVNHNVYGVIGIVIKEQGPDAFEKSILLSIIGECALALENKKNAAEKEEAAILAKNEQLRSNLLRAISHDLRTPLTSISGNASNLLSNGDSFDKESKIQLYTDIYDDSMWLINLVENLLSVTRLEESKVRLSFTTELIDDVITEALHHINRKSVEHRIFVEHENEFLLVKIDAKLIVQVFINIIDNAIKYTPVNSEIKINTRQENDYAVISISDNGAGISDERKARIFDMFYCGESKIIDSRRSLGLGLSLCKSIINAHNGQIYVTDNQPHGTTFTFTLPAGEVNLYE